MNYDILFIQEYYHYLIIFFVVLIFLIFLNYLKKNNRNVEVNFVIFIFALFTVYYIGSRDLYVGVDTIRYKNTFEQYQSTSGFFVRKDFFYDYLNYIIGKVTNFHGLLLINATLYIMGAWYGLKKIFKKDYILPFLIFLISPYFINNGINVMRSGIATSIFIVGVALFYTKSKVWKWLSLLLVSVLFHLSLLVPLTFFLITRYFNRTKLIFFVWLTSIFLSVLNINIIASLLPFLDFIADRAGAYVETSEEQNSWVNFFIFGFFPVAFGIYNILILKYKDLFYKWLMNTYMLAHIPYIILISSEYASRLAFLSEFMMPILIMYPLLINPVIQVKYYRLRYAILIFFVFIIKAYKILII